MDNHVVENAGEPMHRTGVVSSRLQPDVSERVRGRHLHGLHRVRNTDTRQYLDDGPVHDACFHGEPWRSGVRVERLSHGSDRKRL